MEPAAQWDNIKVNFKQFFWSRAVGADKSYPAHAESARSDAYWSRRACLCEARFRSQDVSLFFQDKTLFLKISGETIGLARDDEENYVWDLTAAPNASVHDANNKGRHAAEDWCELAPAAATVGWGAGAALVHGSAHV